MGWEPGKIFAGKLNQGQYWSPSGRGWRGRGRDLLNGFTGEMASADDDSADGGSRLQVSCPAQTDGHEGGVCADKLFRIWGRQRHIDPAEVVVSRIQVQGLGAVSPAGWGLESLRNACAQRAPLPV